MVTVNIVSDTQKYHVNDNGEVSILLKDIENTYESGANPSKIFLVKPVGNTMADLNRALLLAKEDAIDYFKGEAEAIARRKLVEAGMALTTIPDTIFNGDPATYTKTVKKGESNEELIIKDTIIITPLDPLKLDSNIFNVVAYIMRPDEDRGQALCISTVWNKNAGYPKLKEDLILKYRGLKVPSTDWLQGDVRENIGTDIPK